MTDKLEIPKPDFFYEPYTKITDGYHTYEILKPAYDIRNEMWEYHVIDHTDDDEMHSELIALQILNHDFEKVDDEESEKAGDSE